MGFCGPGCVQCDIECRDSLCLMEWTLLLHSVAFSRPSPQRVVVSRLCPNLCRCSISRFGDREGDRIWNAKCRENSRIVRFTPDRVCQGVYIDCVSVLLFMDCICNFFSFPLS